MRPRLFFNANSLSSRRAVHDDLELQSENSRKTFTLSHGSDTNRQIGFSVFHSLPSL